MILIAYNDKLLAENIQDRFCVCLYVCLANIYVCMYHIIPNMGPTHIRSIPLVIIWIPEALGNFWMGTWLGTTKAIYTDRIPFANPKPIATISTEVKLSVKISAVPKAKKINFCCCINWNVSVYYLIIIPHFVKMFSRANNNKKYTLQVLLIARRNRLSRYIILDDWCNHSLKKGDTHLLMRSTIAITLIMVAIFAVPISISARINGVSIEKFASAKIAIDIPNMMFT